MKKLIITTIFSVLAVSCSQKETGISITFPVYEECLTGIEGYNEYLRSTYGNTDSRIEISVTRFDHISPAHGSIVGFGKVTSYGSDRADKHMDVTVNTIKAGCFPESGISSSTPELVEVILKYQNTGAAKNYVVIEGEEVTTWYNDGKSKMPGTK